MPGKGVCVMRRLYLELKNQQYYYFVPLVVLFILTPLMVYATLKNSSGDCFPEFAFISQLFIPVFSAWWPLFIMKEYLNSPGKELLFSYRTGRDSLSVKMLILWAYYSLHVLAAFIYFSSIFDFVWYLFIAVISQSLLLIAAAYYLSLLFQNTFMPLILNFTYCLFFRLVEDFDHSPLNIFGQGIFNSTADLGKAAVLAAVALVILWCGFRIEKDLFKNSI